MTVKCQSRLQDECFKVSSYLLVFAERPTLAVHYYGRLRCDIPHELSVPRRALVTSGGGVTVFL